MSANEVMCTVLFDAKVIIWQEYLLKDTTINMERYCETLKNLRKAIKRKRPGLLIEGVILLHDNACSHNKNVTQELLQQISMGHIQIALLPRPRSIQFCTFRWEKVF